jgi:ribosome-associated toxin RatA of RatAB toxin-antitoxin module
VRDKRLSSPLRSPALGCYYVVSPVGSLITPSGLATAHHSCALDTIQQEMERLPQGARRLAVQLRVDLADDLIWSVLTDYENLSRFIPNLSTSRLLWRRDDRVGLEQVGCQQFCGLRFSARVELELQEVREHGMLRFAMTQGDFRRFEGAWQVSPDPIGSRLLYDLTVQGRPGMPIALIEQRLREDLAANLRAVQQEALRRSVRH